MSKAGLSASPPSPIRAMTDPDTCTAAARDELRLRLRSLQAPSGLTASQGPRHSDFDLNRGHVPAHARLREAAVLVPLVAHETGLTVLLTQRTKHLKHHAGQVSFPGGRVEEEDNSRIATALRETEEEIGLSSEHMEPVGLLDDYETVTGFLVTPVVAMVRPGFNLRLDAFEVADAFEVPLEFILDPINHQIHSRERDGVRRRYFVFEYRQRYIWGATAGMLMNLYRRLNALNGPMRPPPPAPISSPLD